MLSRALRAIYTILLTLIIATGAPAVSFTGKVIAVTDGDTIQVMNGKVPVKVRLLGIDCPETHQNFGSAAKKTTSDLTFGKIVSVKTTKQDRYGRLVGVVTLPGGMNLNQELVRRGMAWWYREYAPHSTELPKLEAQAKSAKVGLWSQAKPIAPWDWRAAPVISTPSASKAKELPQKLPSNKVYITENGKKYHRAGCCALRKSSTPILKSLAIDRGYKPCDRCNP